MKNFKMKKLLFLATLFFGLALLTFSCKDQSKEDIRNKAVESVKVTPPPTTPNAATTSSVNVSGGKHYICPNNCEGSGGEGGKQPAAFCRIGWAC